MLLTLIPGFVEPSDMAEMKRLASEMGIKTLMFPDTSGVLNGPMTGRFKMYPAGGARLDEIRRAGDSVKTLALGSLAAGQAARSLDTKCKVDCEILDLPIGFLATDRYVEALRKSGDYNVPDSITFERGQLIDVISDMSQYLYGKRVALAGDPDQLVALTEFLVSMDMHPVHIVTGTPGKKFEEKIRELTSGISG